MATETTNYKLKKPEKSDPIDITVLNENFDKIDEQMKKNAQAIPPVATSKSAGIVKPDGTSITVDEDGTIHGAQTYELPAASSTVLGGVKIGKNITVGEDGTINAYADFNKDDVPTQGSNNAVSSGGTYQAIKAVDDKANTLSSQVNSLMTGIVWKNAVSTYDSIATTYPTPEDGWTVTCLDTKKVYQYDGTAWNEIFVITVPVASVADVEAVLGVTS